MTFISAYMTHCFLSQFIGKLKCCFQSGADTTVSVSAVSLNEDYLVELHSSIYIRKFFVNLHHNFEEGKREAVQRKRKFFS